MTDMTITPDEAPTKPYLATAATIVLLVAVLGAWHLGRREGAVGPAQEIARESRSGVDSRQDAAHPAPVPAVVAPQPGVSASGTMSPEGRARRSMSVYLVGTPEQAEQTWFGLHEAETIRYLLGEPAVRSAVLLVDSEDEARLLRLLGDADAVRDALGLPPLLVEDLRTP